jgi:hypothetical protein
MPRCTDSHRSRSYDSLEGSVITNHEAVSSYGKILSLEAARIGFRKSVMDGDGYRTLQVAIPFVSADGCRSWLDAPRSLVWCDPAAPQT